MYIKQLIIQGFKSYRDRIVVEPFDPGHNVIVGRNGSGKSNFFSAIQFVLSDEFSHLRAEQRQSLLHEGVGPRVVNAYVEIVFDNADGRIPIEKGEVHLRRMIGSKKDNYFLNGTTIPRSDVMNLLESAGFSRSNPYYIVKQGEINQMATATDTERLNLLREVAGTRVYDERTEESKALVSETQVRVEKSAECLQTIEERLQDLEEEKEELREYERWDKQRRCLEYLVYQREAKEAKQKLASLTDSYGSSITEQRTVEKAARTAQEMICAVTERWKIASNDVEAAEQEQAAHNGEMQQLIKKATKLSLMIKDLREEMRNDEEGRKTAETELEDLQRRIDERTSELETINPEYEKLLKEEEELTRELTLKEQQRNELYAKQGRVAQFHSKEARNEWIQDQLNQLAQQINEKLAHRAEIEANLAADRQRQETLEEKIESQRGEIEQQKKSIENYEEQRYREVEEKDRAQSSLKELYRQESALEAKLSIERENLLQAEQSLRFLVGKQIFNGRESVRKVLDTFRESPGMSIDAERYCGQVIDNFSCERGTFTAVEVIAGKRLFHHIVENDEFGTKILKEINRQRLPGEVTFMPLNRLKVSAPNYPISSDAIPMITKLVYDAKYDRAMRFIFGKSLICRNLEVATKLARESGLDCVTLEGDLASSKGFLTGGHYNRDRTPLGDYARRTSVAMTIRDLEIQLSDVKTEIGRVSQALSSQISKIQRLDALIRKAKNTYEAMEGDTRGMKSELNAIRSYRIPKERSLAQCAAALEAMRATREGWEREMGEDLVGNLSSEAKELLETLNEDIRSLTRRSKAIFERRIKAETEKTQLENLLTNNLTRRRDELTQILRKIAASDRQRQLETCEAQLAKVEEERKTAEIEIQAQCERLEVAKQTLKTQADELQTWKMTRKDALAKFEENSKVLEKFTSRKNTYEQKIAEATEKIAALGALPSAEAFENFERMSTKDLFRELQKTNNQLKRYSHVNKKALDQFLSFSEQREKLARRKEELDRANEKIVELMTALDLQKYEAIQFTFKQVSKYFGEVFRKLAPTGRATLVMKTANGGSNEDDGSGARSCDEFTGVAIRVSFSDRTTESSEMSQLSGGQKSLVALALIFAIQKCDPAPFYLFDEIDQALDAQHRDAVATMIHELSADAQFITTTFKPEMIQRANKFYGVKYRNKVSHIDCVTQDEAADFVEGDPHDGQ